jgi:repressor LexA
MATRQRPSSSPSRVERKKSVLNGNDKPKLTEKQRQIYDFLRDKIINRGYGPTVREIGSQFGISSPNGVMCHLKALEKKGFITRESHMSRAIQLSDPPRQASTLPLAGQIAAGRPLLAEQQDEEVDFAHLFDHEDHFCLRVKGDSMIEDQIADGDYIVVRKQDTCRDGETVVALVDGHDATLKRFYRDRDRIRLEPANSMMKPIYSKNVQVLGVLAGVIRRC